MKQNIISKQFISSFLVLLYVKNTLKAKSPYVCRVIHGLCVCDFVARCTDNVICIVQSGD